MHVNTDTQDDVRLMKFVVSFMSGEAVGGWGSGGKPAADDNDTRRSARLLLITACSRQQTSTTCFAGDSGYWTLVSEVILYCLCYTVGF